jgi:hypothetical protein
MLIFYLWLSIAALASVNQRPKHYGPQRGNSANLWEVANCARGSTYLDKEEVLEMYALGVTTTEYNRGWASEL